MISLKDIRDILLKYQDRYRWLDVFAGDVEEFSDSSYHQQFKTVDDKRFRVMVEDQVLEVWLSPEAKVARFELVNVPIKGALAGASVGAALGSLVDESNSPAGAVFGLLVGGIAGVWAESAARPQKVLTLKYDSAQGRWRVYNGPYVSWAKEALQAS